jgi:hypothetical protein
MGRLLRLPPPFVPVARSGYGLWIAIARFAGDVALTAWRRQRFK